MFTGIIEKLGVVQRIDSSENLTKLYVRALRFTTGVKKGDSISVNGVCLTVVSLKGGVIEFDVMKESLDSTTIKNLLKGDKVNLEKALKFNGRIDGHFVTGHVDTVIKIKDRIELKNYLELVFTVNKSIGKYIAQKGSVCIDGVSLTVGWKKSDSFSVYLIPLTSKLTTLGFKKKGESVNLEVDILARYVLNK